MPGKTYYYWVKARSNDGVSGFGSPDTGRSLLQVGDVLLYKGTSLVPSVPIRVAELLQLQGFGYSHSAVYLGQIAGTDQVAEMGSSGHVVRSLESSVGKNMCVDVFRMKGIDSATGSAIASKAQSYKGTKYAFQQIAVLGVLATYLWTPYCLLGLQLPSLPDVDRAEGGKLKMICSEMVAWAYYDAGKPISVVAWPAMEPCNLWTNLDRKMDYTTPCMLANSSDMFLVGRLTSGLCLAPPAPSLRIDGLFLSQKQQGATFRLTGAGFTPSTTATWHVITPNGDGQDEGILVKSDGTLTVWNRASSCASSVGRYRMWVTDSVRGDSDVVYEVIDASPACTPALVVAPTVETRSATGVTQTSGTVWGAVTSDGGASITERRFDWGKTSACSDGWTNQVTVSGNTFSVQLTGLGSGTTYYFRASASNSAGWTQGTVLSFTTATPTPPVTTPTFSPLAGTYAGSARVSISCATSGATIRYTTNGSDPTSSSTAYSSALTFTSTTTLKARAFKTGMTDSSVASGTYTIPPPTPTVTTPTVETRSATGVSQTSGTVWGAVTSDGGASITERRFDWGTTSSCSDGWTNQVTVSGSTFSFQMTGLSPNTKYYFRAWAKNSAGWAQGTVLSFTTTTPTPTVATPTVETRSATGVSQTSGTVWGSVTSDGGAGITERRFDWGATSSCSDGWTSQVTVSGSTFSFQMTGLSPNTKHYFRAWAKNSAGWGQGTVSSFTTAASTPAADIRITVSDSSPQFSKASNSGHPEYWKSYTYQGHFYIYTYTGTAVDCWAQFRPTLPASGTYDVYACFYADPQNSTHVPYTVYYSGGSSLVSVNEYAPSYFTWREVRLGSWYFEAGTGGRVVVTDATGESYNGTTTLNVDTILFRRQ